MSEILGLETGIDFSVSGITGTFAVYLMWIFGFLLLAAVGILAIWWFNQKRIFNKEIVIFENLSGQGWQVTGKDKARFLRLSKDGTEVLFLKNKKMPLTAYGRKMGKNQYWFAIGQDGGWYNFLLGDLDAKMGLLDIEPVDRDIKYVSVAMRRNAKEDYGQKQSFMDKWGTWIFSLLWLIIGIAGASYLIDQMGDIASQLAGAAAEFAKVAEPIQRALGHVDSICQGGTGLVQA